MEQKNCLKDYLGDGVYAIYDGAGITLCANDYEYPTDKIYLESTTLKALYNFEKRCLETKNKGENK